MFLKVALAVVAIVGLFLVYVSTRKGEFNYEVSGIIQAPVEKVFPYVSDLKLGGEWSPFEEVDPNMKKEYVGPTNQVGSKMTFAGNNEAGSGSLEILKIVPNELVELRLIMTAPLKADNIVQYRLSSESGGTRFTWSMSGDGGFVGKLVTVFVDCEKMIQEQFAKGISNLKVLVEEQSK